MRVLFFSHGLDPGSPITVSAQDSSYVPGSGSSTFFHLPPSLGRPGWVLVKTEPLLDEPKLIF